MKHWKYLKYLLRHKYYVFVAGRKVKAPLWRLIIHDWSKFLPGEWFPYVEYFYGPTVAMKDSEPDDYRYWTAREPVIESFQLAWLRHQHRSPHHWQHWILCEDSGETKRLYMPDKFVREMVADWAGAGKAITGRWEVKTWYEKNKAKIVLHPATRDKVEALLEEFFA